MSGTRFGDVRFTAETGSTNADLMALASRGVTDPIVLVTDHQTAGRGRQDRSWFDEPGDSLLVSVLIRADFRWAGVIPLAAGLAAVEAVNGLLGTDEAVSLKWPNDVLVPGLGERKLAGILVEAITGSPLATDVDPAGSGDSLPVVIGMGVNLRWSTPPPDDVARRAVTLEAVLEQHGSNPSRTSLRDDLLTRYLRALDGLLTELASAGGPDVVVERYRTVCLTVGRLVALDTPSGPITGTAEGIGPGGELMVRRPDGSVVPVTAGDAHHLPPTAG